LSNYWTANVYFKARNGTYKRVPQIPNRDLFNDKYTGKTKGGFVVYYVSGGKGQTTAFKPVCYDELTDWKLDVDILIGFPHASRRSHQPCQQEHEDADMLSLLQRCKFWR
jgi:hypothetical protein